MPSLLFVVHTPSGYNANRFALEIFVGMYSNRWFYVLNVSRIKFNKCCYFEWPAEVKSDIHSEAGGHGSHVASSALRAKWEINGAVTFNKCSGTWFLQPPGNYEENVTGINALLSISAKPRLRIILLLKSLVTNHWLDQIIIIYSKFKRFYLKTHLRKIKKSKQSMFVTTHLRCSYLGELPITMYRPTIGPNPLSKYTNTQFITPNWALCGER